MYLITTLQHQHYIYTDKFTCIFTPIYLCIHISSVDTPQWQTCVHLYTKFVRIFIFVRVYLCTYIYTRTATHISHIAHTDTGAQTHIRKHATTNTHTHKYKNIHYIEQYTPTTHATHERVQGHVCSTENVCVCECVCCERQPL